MSEGEESILAEINARFTELRTLMITIGSILALLMPVVHNLGIIDLDLLGEDDDDSETPYVCEPDWVLIADHYVIEYDLLLNMRVSDTNLCNEVHTISYYIAMDEYEAVDESEQFRNTYLFTHTIEDIEEGTHHVLIEVMNGSIDLYESIVFDFEFDEGEHENAVYGCTDPEALNYNETATHDDGTCEYEEEEEEITDDCLATFYDAYAVWANNNTTIYADFDVDFSCQANVTVTVQVQLIGFDNSTEEPTLYSLGIGNHTYNTYHYDWDYHFMDFNNLTEPYYDAVLAQFRVYHEDEEDDAYSVWVQ